MSSLDLLKSQFEQALILSLDKYSYPQGFESRRLQQVMSYALMSPGKRLRPLLVLACAKNIKHAMPAALAIEYVHTYSLIHDDLPAMDNDDYRRGRLSAHRYFNEGEAILAGDALLADAFYFLSGSKINPSLMCQELALTAGRHGLPAGQAEDLAFQKQNNNKPSLLEINQAKTARLFEACAVLGALSSNIKNLEPWRNLGNNFGVAFQLKDDLDDNTNYNPGELRLLLRAHINSTRDLVKILPNSQMLEELIYLTFG